MSCCSWRVKATFSEAATAEPWAPMQNHHNLLFYKTPTLAMLNLQIRQLYPEAAIINLMWPLEQRLVLQTLEQARSMQPLLGGWCTERLPAWRPLPL